MFEVKKAKRQRRPLKISLEGLSGSGKTYTALRLAFALRRAGVGKRIVIADSENESAGLYDGITTDGEKWEYDVCPIPVAKQNPDGYSEVYEYLIGQGYDIVIIDSMSHAWHGAMEQVDAYAQRNKGDKFGGWAKVTPSQRRMLSLITDPRAHLIATMRVKGEYERVEGANGRDKIKKVGMKTDQREGTEYEFDCVVRLDVENHHAQVEKVRGCTAMDGRTGNSPGPEFWKPLIDWWKTGSEYVTPTAALIPPAKSAPRETVNQDTGEVTEDRPDRELVEERLTLMRECRNRAEFQDWAAATALPAVAAKLTPDGKAWIQEQAKAFYATLPAAKPVKATPAPERKREPGDDDAGIEVGLPGNEIPF